MMCELRVKLLRPQMGGSSADVSWYLCRRLLYIHIYYTSSLLKYVPYISRDRAKYTGRISGIKYRKLDFR